MRTLYNILTIIASVVVKLLALNNKKLKLGVEGRKQTFSILKSTINNSDYVIWCHCASLGEYEQGLPVFEKLKEKYPNYKLVLSFFSPSGYEIRKNSPIADCVVYLPLDTKYNAKRFLDLINPKLVFFVKYEIWPNYLNEIKKRYIEAYLISALFKKEQAFFNWKGAWMRKYLEAFTHIFTQNQVSKELLNSYNFENVSVSGDTRFDRVTNQLSIDNTLDFIENFKGNCTLFVAGSSWLEGEKLITEYINNCNDDTIKFLIAPHDIKPKNIERLKKSISVPYTTYSEKEHQDLNNSKVFIADTIGILSKIYCYADIAYVGGGLGNNGLHNTLEAAVFGAPIIIGQNHKKFPEAIDMINLGGMFSISNQESFNNILNKLINNKEFRVSSGKKNLDYVEKNKGSVLKIVDFLNK